MNNNTVSSNTMYAGPTMAQAAFEMLHKKRSLYDDLDRDYREGMIERFRDHDPEGYNFLTENNIKFEVQQGKNYQLDIVFESGEEGVHAATLFKMFAEKDYDNKSREINEVR